jgi:hypothetical protein
MAVGSEIQLDDVLCILDGDEYELNTDEVAEFKKSGKLPTGAYMVFSVNISNNGKVETLNVAPYTLFAMDVLVGEERVKLGKYLSHTKAGTYNADADKAEAIDFTNLNEITVKTLEHQYETRPTVIAHREESSLFKQGTHYVPNPDEVGTFKHYKYASKDHEGFGQMFAEASDAGKQVDYTKVAKQPVNAGANPLMSALVHVNYQA